ncbi:MAG TPA: NADH-quinone oxidoreductase subunit K [Candidatus Methylomirabilis sp.]|nr:NADH-quinone oxidoreductase subunit K [Candidatus Methylomirabilis sp.]
MELPMAMAIAVLYAAGTFMILRPNLIRMVMGFGLYSNATNLLLITVGGYTRTSGAPFVGKDPGSAVGLMDPLPPDIILTAIVISFAVSALFLIICYRVYADHGTDNPEELRVDDDFGHEAEAWLDGAARGVRELHRDDGEGQARGPLSLLPTGEPRPTANPGHPAKADCP